jgi:tetratricopeptide (TPR) repeat protein
MKRTIAMLLLAGCLAAPAAAQQSPLTTARDLYAAARYDEALIVLNSLRPNENNAVDLKVIEQYRSLCLLALGRTQEAEAAIAAVVAADPMYQPSESEASPRVRAAFSEVRQRQLPEIARARYASAKATYERKDFVNAERQFSELLRLIDDPEMAGRLGDMRVLVSGFLDLSSAAAAPPPAPQKVEPSPAPPPPQTRTYPVGHIFSAEEPDVVPPVVQKQEVPSVPTSIRTQIREKGLLEVIIDEQGRVIGLDLRLRLHPIFDSQLLSAAKDWRYRPAMLNGRPVRYRKLVQISVSKP